MAVVPTVSTAASLYVGDLHPDVDDGHLLDAFSEYKSLASVRVCRDSSTGRSLCYGYVNFLSPQEALHAIEARNHSLLNGKVIRVMWSHRDSDARRSGIGNIFVKNLSDSVSSVELEDMFRKFGNILSCKVAMSDDGKSKGYGFVQFESDDSAKIAIEKANGLTIGDKQLYVGKFVKKSDRVLAGIDAKYTNLYMKNLDPEIEEELLQKKFSAFGKIASLVIARDNSGTPKGFGFVNFENSDDAKLAMEAMNGSQLGSKVLYVARAQKKSERQQILSRQFEEKRKEQLLKYQGSNVYVKNINDDVTDEELREHFIKCGTITSVKLMRDDKGISKGFGFVCFSSPEDANKAVNTFHGYMFHGKPLYAAIAQKKEDRQARLQLHFAQRIGGLSGPTTALIPGGYPPYFYPAPPGVVPQMPQRPSLMYQPLLRPGWRPNTFAPPTRPGFQPLSVPVIPGAPRQPRQNRGRMNGTMLSQNAAHSASYIQNFQLPQSMIPSKDSGNLQNGQVKFVNRGSKAVGAGAEGQEMLSSMLAAAAPEQQKQILGERLYPLVQNHKPELAAKITGMLLEMDNSELLLLLESPEFLAAKVEEAVEVLKISKTKVSDQEGLHPSYLSSTQVAVN